MSSRFAWMTRYSAGISLALHILFLWSANNLFLSWHKSPPPKPLKYKLSFVVPKPPPPPPEVKKVEPHVMPKPMKQVEKVVAEKPPEPQREPAVVRQAVTPMTTAKRVETVPMVKALEQPVSEPALSRPEGTRMASMVQNSAHRVLDPGSAAPRAIQTGEPEGMRMVSMVQNSAHRVLAPSTVAPRAIQTGESVVGRGSEGVTMVSSNAKKVSLPTGWAPRPIPEIVADPQILKGYLGVIQRKIERAKEYPDIARRAGNQGKVKVQFTILKDGRIENPVLIEEAPYRILNEEAMAALHRAAPFERLPDEIGKDSLNVVLPFSFMLN